MAFNFVSQRVKRAGQCMLSVIVCSFALQMLYILTLATAAHSILVKVTLNKPPIVLVTGVSGQSPHPGCKLFGRFTHRQISENKGLSSRCRR